jgi:Ca2+/Na+ antiporter
MGSILILIAALVGLSFIFGGFQAERLTRLLIWLVLAPVVICFFNGVIVSAYSQLSPYQQIAMLVLLPFAILLFIRTSFPGSRFVKQIIDALIVAFAFVLTLPFRIIWRSIRLVVERERHPVRLSPTPVVVGHRPQMESAANSKDNSPESSKG